MSKEDPGSGTPEEGPLAEEPADNIQKVVLFAPSGTGKTTVVKLLLELVPDLVVSVSMTTRQPREGEVHGRDYYFVEEDHFFALRDAGLFAEHAPVHNAWYGTPLAPIREAARARKRAVLLPIDFKGGARLESDFANVLQVLLIPPSLTELERRLVSRGSDSPERVKKRLAMGRVEMEQHHQASHVIVNHDPQQAARELYTIMEAERLRRHRQKWVEAVLAGETLVP